MADLSNWDCVHNFQAREAAALIIGIDPGNVPETEKHRIAPVLRSIWASYVDALDHPDKAREALECDDWGVWIFSAVLIHILNVDPTNKAYTDAEAAGRLDLEFQTFDREQITRWLAAIKMKSVYSFNPAQAEAVPAPTGRWPWGDHHTKLLGHLEAAARRYWVSYDPADATTASTNATVIEWLKTERRVSGKRAEAIASMLRPDGLPTGPRK